MKKLLLVLLVVTLASFLFVGCLPGVTPPAEGEGEGEGEAEICPAITITGAYAGVDKTYVKTGAIEIVVTYDQPTEGVSIYIVTTAVTTLLPYYVSADGLVYTASSSILGNCGIFMIKVVDCYGECICIESFVVDSYAPKAQMMLSVDGCVCGDCEIALESDYTITGTCVDDLGCCGDECSGFASWSVDVYDTDPFDECCTIPCETPIKSCSAIACPIDCTTACVVGNDYSATAPDYYYIIMSMLDNVGNEAKYFARVEFDSGCTVSKIEFWNGPNDKASTSSYTCLDWDLPTVWDGAAQVATGYDLNDAVAAGELVVNATYGMYAIVGEGSCGTK